MDWLCVHYVIIDCDQRRVLFTNSKEVDVLSAQQVLGEFKEGASCYVILTKMEVGQEKGCSQIVVF